GREEPAHVRAVFARAHVVSAQLGIVELPLKQKAVADLRLRNRLPIRVKDRQLTEGRMRIAFNQAAIVGRSDDRAVRVLMQIADERTVKIDQPIMFIERIAADTRYKARNNLAGLGQLP